MLVLSIAQASATNAPADQYFGKLKMSAVRIRYETMQLRKRYETHQLLPEQAEHLATLTDDAYQDWSHRYPHDEWLPSTGFLLGQFYAVLPGGSARSQAVALFVYVKSKFPTSPYARLSRDQLHRGVSTKPYPAWATEAKAQTPTPATSPTPAAPAASPTQSAAPAALPTRSAAPVPTTPSPPAT